MLHLEGCHWIDFMRWVTSAEVVEVSAQLANLSGEAIDVEDTAILALRFDNGMLGSLHGAHTQEQKPSELFFGLRGLGGWVRWEENRPEFVAHSSHPSWTAAAPPPEDAGEARGYGLAVLERFFASVRGQAAPLFAAADARRVLEVIDAAHESARTGRAVAVGRPGRSCASTATSSR
jgi:predicted dehydrogenase